MKKAILAACLLVLSSSPAGAGHNGVSGGFVSGKLVAHRPVYIGRPNVLVGCDVGIYSSGVLHEVRFFYGEQGTPVDVCRLPLGWWVRADVRFAYIVCNGDICEEKLALEGTWLEARPR